MTTEYSGSGDVHRSMELLWELHERPTRGPKPALTLDRIVAAAIEVADAEGLEALSMRRVAAKLGVGTMSLYRYVPGKSELLDLMLDRVVATPPEETPSDSSLGWRELLEGMARGGWRICLDHPWYPFVDQARPVLGPNLLASVEYVVRHLKKTGLADQEIIMIITALDHFVIATARTYISEKQAEQRTGISHEDYWSAQEPALHKAMASGRYPTMAGLSEDCFSFTHEKIFEFGLQRLLDGFEIFIDGPANVQAYLPEPHHGEQAG